MTPRVRCLNTWLITKMIVPTRVIFTCTKMKSQFHQAHFVYDVLKHVPTLDITCLKGIIREDLSKFFSKNSPKIKVPQSAYDEFVKTESVRKNYCEPIEIIENKECQICLIDFEEDDTKVVSVNCGHCVHQACNAKCKKPFRCFCGLDFETSPDEEPYSDDDDDIE